MGNVFAVIGLCWIVKILWKSGVLTMNKQKVLAEIKRARFHYQKGYSSHGMHEILDDVVSAVCESDKSLQKSEQSLEEHIIAHLLTIKQEKERETLATKAKKAIESLAE